MVSLVATGVVLLILAGFGRRCLTLAGYDFPSLAEQLPFAAGLGLGIYGYAILAVGLLGWLNTPVVISLLLLPALWAWRETWQLLVDLWDWAKRTIVQPHDVVQWLLGGTIAAFVLLDLLGALAPPSAADVLVYQLAIPKLYAKAGAIYNIPFHTYSYLPFTLNMIYAASLLLAGDIMAKLFHFACGLLTLSLIWGFGRRYVTRHVALLAMLIFIATPLVSYLMVDALTDLGVALFFSLSFVSLLRYLENHQLKWSVLAGLFGGFALGTKLTALFPLFALGLYYLYRLIRERRITGQSLAHASSFVVVLAVVASPWFIKNIIYTGNPVFPFYYGIFGGRYWSDALQQTISQNTASKAIGFDLLCLIATPWLKTVQAKNPVNFGYLYLAFLPFSWLLQKSSGRRIVFAILAMAGIMYIPWFFLLVQTERHYIALTPLLALGVAAVVQSLVTASYLHSWTKKVVYTSVVVGVATFLAMAFVQTLKYVPVSLGLQSRDAFLDEYGCIQEPYRYANAHLPPGSRVMVVGVWDLFYYLDVDYLNGNPLSQGYIDYSTINSEGELLARLQAEGVTYLLLRTWGAMGPPDRGALPRALPQRAEALYYRLAYDCGKEIASFPYTMPASRTLGTVENESILRIFELRYPSSRGQSQPSARSTPTMPRQPR